MRRTSLWPYPVCNLLLVVPYPADLVPHLRVEGVLLERRLGSGARPPVSHALDLPFRGRLHNRFSEGKALLPDDVLEELALQVGMRGHDAVRCVRAEDVEVAVLEAVLALVEHLEGLRLVVLQRGDGFLQHRLGFLLGAELAFLRGE